MQESSDIVTSRAWQDDDHADEAPWFGWRIEHLWCHLGRRASYTTCDSDGNHDPFDGRSVVRYMKEADESWKIYAAWVALNASDPLNEYFVKEEVDDPQTWTCQFKSWPGAEQHGLQIVALQRTLKPAVAVEDAPADVRDYFQAKKVDGIWVMEDVKSVADVLDNDATVTSDTITAVIPLKKPNPNYKKQLVAAALSNVEDFEDVPQETPQEMGWVDSQGRP